MSTIRSETCNAGASAHFRPNHLTRGAMVRGSRPLVNSTNTRDAATPKTCQSSLQICCRAFLLVMLLAGVAAQAAGLPDTGQTTCYNNSGADSVPASNPASVAGDAGTHPRQDCRFGRDVAAAASVLPKVGAGIKGLDYSKIANDGSTLPANATLGANPGDWACTRDNITGLIWEIKTTSGLRNMTSKYTWYSTDGATNGGEPGTNTVTATCNGTPANCDTQDFAIAVNAAGLCNASDWRVPTRHELLTLVLADGSNPSIDPSYFPNTPALYSWSSSTYVKSPVSVWTVSFDTGFSNGPLKTNVNHVRLVRGGPF